MSRHLYSALAPGTETRIEATLEVPKGHTPPPWIDVPYGGPTSNAHRRFFLEAPQKEGTPERPSEAVFGDRIEGIG